MKENVRGPKESASAWGGPKPIRMERRKGKASGQIQNQRGRLLGGSNKIF